MPRPGAPARRRRAVAVATALALATCVPAARAARTAEPAVPAVPTVATVLAGGVGDGGPATVAQVNASYVAADDVGDVWFYDRLSRQVRRLDHSSGTVRAVVTPALPGGASVAHLWVAGSDVYLDVVTSRGEHSVDRLSPDGSTTTVHDTRPEDGDLRVLLVRRDGSLVRSRGSGETGVTELRPADGGPATVLAGHASRSAAEAADGTLVLLDALGAGIERVRPGGTAERIAGTGAAGPAGPGGPGRPATETTLAADLVAITPDGYRVLFAQGGPRILGFEPGGPVTDVASAPAGARPAERVCDAALTALTAGPAGVYSACGGPIRFHDSAPGPETPPGPGTVVAGANRLRGFADAPAGTPASRAYLGRVRDVAAAPDGRVAMATRGGVFAVSGAKLQRLLAGAPGDDPDAAALTNRQYADQEAFAETGVDIDFGPDGTLYALGRDHGTGAEGWLLRSVKGGGTPEVLAGGGTKVPATGSTGPGSRLGPGHLAVAGDGRTVWFSQTDTSLVWALDLAGGKLTKAAGGGPGGPRAPRDGVPATAAPLPVVTWLGRDARTGGLLLADGNLHRVDAKGVLRAVPSGAGPTYASTPDGSLYSAATSGKRLWRRQPDGAFVVAFGAGQASGNTVGGNTVGGNTVGGATVGGTTVGPRIAAGPGGGVVVADAPGPSARVRVVTPPAAPAAWTEAAASLSVSPVSDGGRRVLRVEATLPAAAKPWRLVVRLDALPRRPGPDLGDVVLDGTVPAGGGTRTMLVRGLEADRRYVVGLFPTLGDGTTAPPATFRRAPAP